MNPKTYSIAPPCNPCKVIEQSAQTVTKIVYSTNGGLAGCKQTVYGEILREDENYVHFHDFITDSKIRLGHQSVNRIDEAVMLFTATYDMSEHANYHKTTCAKYIRKQSYEFEKGSKVQLVSFGTGDQLEPVFFDNYIERL